MTWLCRRLKSVGVHIDPALNRRHLAPPGTNEANRALENRDLVIQVMAVHCHASHGEAFRQRSVIMGLVILPLILLLSH